MWSSLQKWTFQIVGSLDSVPVASAAAWAENFPEFVLPMLNLWRSADACAPYSNVLLTSPTLANESVLAVTRGFEPPGSPFTFVLSTSLSFPLTSFSFCLSLCESPFLFRSFFSFLTLRFFSFTFFFLFPSSDSSLSLSPSVPFSSPPLSKCFERNPWTTFRTAFETFVGRRSSWDQ